jgi:hypothetical protein
MTAAAVVVILLISIVGCSGRSGDRSGPTAQTNGDQMPSKHPVELPSTGKSGLSPTAAKDGARASRPWEKVASRTQGGARITFTSFKDWNLKAENLSPRGHNPLYIPLTPGFRYIMEYPDHPWGHFRVEVKVLETTESFDVPGIGKFECAVVQEEEFFDGAYVEQAHNWFCIDKTTGSIYAMGELTWEIDEVGRRVFDGTWRVGEPDGNGVAEPGLLMPGGEFKVGDKYVYEGHEAEAYGYSENMETGVTVVTPAGKFENCVRVREYSLTNPAVVADKWYCKGVGLVKDSADGVLVASDGLPHTDMSSFGKHHREPKKKVVPPVAKINGVQATEIALKAIPGKARSVKIERLGRRNVYAVEIIADKDGAEWDVFVDIETGEVVGKDK